MNFVVVSGNVTTCDLHARSLWAAERWQRQTVTANTVQSSLCCRLRYELYSYRSSVMSSRSGLTRNGGGHSSTIRVVPRTPTVPNSADSTVEMLIISGPSQPLHSKGMVWLVILVLCIVSATVSADASACLSGWVRYDDRCYLLELGAVTWDSCNTRCSNLGAKMLCIENSQQSSFITQYHPIQSPMVHIGLDMLGGGDFQWYSGCSSSFGSSLPWSPGEPTPGEPCAALVRSNGLFNNIRCDNAQGCGCQQPFITGTKVCPTGWILSSDGNRCYYFPGATMNWPACKTYCEAASSQMLCIQTAGQQSEVFGLRGSGHQTWIGLAAGTLGLLGPFNWNAGCTSSYTNWATLEPNNIGNSYASVYDSSGKWADFSDLTSLECACQQTSIDATPYPTIQPTMKPTAQPSRQPTSQPTGQPTASPTAQPSMYPSAQPSRQPTSQPTGQPTARPSGQPSRRPTDQPSASPTGQPTASPTAQPSMHPSAQPTGRPTSRPSSQPSSGPTAKPSRQPSTSPSAQPAASPTTQPSGQPSSVPSALPSAQPTDSPSARPSAQPSDLPTASPTRQPSANPSAQPSACPSASPTSQPSASPSAHRTGAPIVYTTLAPTASPTIVPSAVPSQQPSSTPTRAPSGPGTILSSPAYKVRNGFAFAAVGQGGAVYAWGEAPYGGNSTLVQQALQDGANSVLHTRFGLSALKDDGMTLWGHIGDTAHALVNGDFTSAATTEDAVALVLASTGQVVAYGSKHLGGNVVDDTYCNGYAQYLAAGVRNITATAGAFAAIKTDGTVFAWGSPHTGGGVSTLTLPALVGVRSVTATREAFAALLGTGAVVTWGAANAGGDSSAVTSELESGVVHVIGGNMAFVAVKAGGKVVVWGHKRYGGDASVVAAQLSSGVVYVAHTASAFAALKDDGGVVTWGNAARGADSSQVQAQLQGITHIVGAAAAFAAINFDGGVVAWGHPSYGAEIPSDKVAALSSGVVSIYHTDHAFAALKSDGSLVVWGRASHGGSPSTAVEALLASGVHTVCANDVAFSAIKTDGSVVGWGHEVSIAAEGVQFTSAALTSPSLC